MFMIAFTGPARGAGDGVPAVARASGGAGAPSRPLAPSPQLRAVSPRVEFEEAMDLDEPIDLDGSWETPAPAGSSIDIGSIGPGQEKTIELPVTASVDGRPVRLSLKVTVRLSR